MIQPRRHSSLRIGLFRAVERTAALLGGRRLYHRAHLAPGRLLVRRERLEIAELPVALEGFTIAQLSDVHAGPFLARGDLDGVLHVLDEEAPDVVCWTGDYVVHGPENMMPALDELCRCVGRRATFAVFGNHDYKGRRELKISEALMASGWQFLRNGGATVEVDGARVAFGGVEDLEEGKGVDFGRGAETFSGANVRVGLCHHPRGAPEFVQRGADLVLSGHSHGTQVDLPWLRRLGPPHPGLRARLGGAALIVSRGLGVIGIPLRIGAPAEVVVVELASAGGGA